MPKNVSKTYGKTRAKESKASVAFDEIQKEEKGSSRSKKGFASAFPRKTPWAKTERVVSKTSPLKNEAIKGRKRRKVSDDDPFAFTDDSEITPSCSDAKLTTSVTKPSTESLIIEVSDCKSTDDEAYSSSQELSESSPQSLPSKVCNTGKSKDKKPASASRVRFTCFSFTRLVVRIHVKLLFRIQPSCYQFILCIVKILAISTYFLKNVSFKNCFHK